MPRRYCVQPIEHASLLLILPLTVNFGSLIWNGLQVCCFAALLDRGIAIAAGEKGVMKKAGLLAVVVAGFYASVKSDVRKVPVHGCRPVLSSPDFPNRKARYSKDHCDLLPAAKLNLFRWQSMRREASSPG
jgi:hypothetical protein